MHWSKRNQIPIYQNRKEKTGHHPNQAKPNGLEMNGGEQYQQSTTTLNTTQNHRWDQLALKSR
jgi:hypothetical protein